MAIEIQFLRHRVHILHKYSLSLFKEHWLLEFKQPAYLGETRNKKTKQKKNKQKRTCMISCHQLTLETAIIHCKLCFYPRQVVGNNESICFTADRIWRWNLCNISWWIFLLLPLYGSNFSNCLQIRRPQQQGFYGTRLGIWMLLSFHHILISTIVSSFKITKLDSLWIARSSLACFWGWGKNKK